MSKCPKQAKKKRNSKKRGKPSDYKQPYKGHTWKGHGKERKCIHCGARCS